MKHRASSLIFRMLWSRIRRPARPRWVGAEHGLKAASPAWAKTVVASALSAFSAGSVWALPQGAQVELGQVSLKQTDKTLTVTTSNGAVINWKQFNIANGELARFLQPSAQSQVLNRVTGGDPSLILGQLQSNGRVFLINPSGVVFGRGARVDVNSLVVSTLPMKTEDFSAGKLQFGGLTGLSRSEGAVRNEGTIQTASGGFVYLVAPEVENSGLIHSPEGQVILAAGHQVSLVDPARPEVAWEVKAPDSRAVNLGDIVSKQIGLHGQQVLNGGRIQATTAQFDAQGRIVLRASKKVEQTASGSLVARGRDAQGNLTGGDIQVHGGEQVTLAGAVDASARPLSREQADLAVRVPSTQPEASAESPTDDRPAGRRTAANIEHPLSGAVAPTLPGPISALSSGLTQAAAAPAAWPIESPAESPLSTSATAAVSRAVSSSATNNSVSASAGAAVAQPGASMLDVTPSVVRLTHAGDLERPPEVREDVPSPSPQGEARVVAGASALRLSAATGATDPKPHPAPDPTPTRPRPDPQHLWAPTALGSGGRVRVSGQDITLSDSLTIDVSGKNQAGTVLIGGERQGQRLGAFEASQPNAQTVTMAATARIQADALGKGQGGHVIVWADDTARVHGLISARGGDQGGEGGFIETSGKRLLDVTRAMDASARNGQAGTWLLDPQDLTITTAATGIGTLIDPSLIEASLNQGTNIALTTGSALPGHGDIWVTSPITKSQGSLASLTLTAAADIFISANVTSSGTSAGLNLVLQPGQSGLGAAVIGHAGGDTVVVDLASGTLSVNTGLGTLLAPYGPVRLSKLSLQAAEVQSGDLSLNLDQVTLASTVQISSADLTITGGLTLASGTTATLDDRTWVTLVADPVTHAADLKTTGTANLRLEGAGMNVIHDTVTEVGTLNIASGLTLQGYGQIHGDWVYTTDPITLIDTYRGTVIHNNGTILANEPGGTLSVVMEHGTLENTGLLAARGGYLSAWSYGGGEAAYTVVAPTDPAEPTLINSGRIEVSDRGTLDLSGTWTNSGTIALSSGELNLGGAFTPSSLGAIARTGGAINLTGILDNTGTSFNIGSSGPLGPGGLNRIGYSGVILGGTLTAEAGKTLFVDGGTLDSVTLGSNFNFTGYEVNLRNSLTLADGVTINKGSSDWDLNSDQGTFNLASEPGGQSNIVSEGGSVYLDNRYDPVSYQYSSGTLNIGSGITLRGYGSLYGDYYYLGQDLITGTSLYSGSTINNAGRLIAENPNSSFYIGVNYGGFNNSGTLSAASGTIQIDGYGTSSITNTGLIQVNANGRFDLGGHWTNTGTINLSSGTLDLGGEFTTNSLGSLQRTGGAIRVTGTLNNTGETLNIGNSGNFGPGGLTGLIDGAIVGGTLVADPGQALYMEYGTLDAVTLGTSLKLAGYPPNLRTSLTLVSGVTLDLGEVSTSLEPNEGTFSFLTQGGAAEIRMVGGDLNLESFYDSAENRSVPATLNIGSGVTIKGGGDIDVNPSSQYNAGQYVYQGGTINNAGTFLANLEDQELYISLPYGGTFNNSGAVVADSGLLAISGYQGPTISNTGSVGVHSNGSLSLSGNWTNLGTMQLTSGTLDLGGTFTASTLGTFQRSGGSVELSGTLTNTQSTLNFGQTGLFGPGGLNVLSGSVVGGTIIADPGQVLDLQYGKLDNVTLGSNLTVNGGSGTLMNALTLADGVTLNSGSVSWRMDALSGVFNLAAAPGAKATMNWNGGGGLRTESRYDNTISGYRPVDLNIGSGLTLSSPGQIYAEYVGRYVGSTYVYTGSTITNSGTISADVAGRYISISPTYGNFINQGSLVANRGSIYSYGYSGSSISNNGWMGGRFSSISITGGTSFQQNGTLGIGLGTRFEIPSFINQGLIQGSGTLTLMNSGTVQNQGSFESGYGGHGTLTVQGQFNQTTGTLLASGFNLLNVTDTASLGGTVRVSEVPDYGQYRFIQAGSLAANTTPALIDGAGTDLDGAITLQSGLSGGASFSSRASEAASYVIWDGSSDGDGDGVSWSDPLNWSSNAVPTSGSRVAIALEGASVWVIENQGTLASLSISNSAQLNLAGQGAEWSAGTLAISGSATFGSAGSQTPLLLTGGTLQLVGTGSKLVATTVEIGQGAWQLGSDSTASVGALYQSDGAITNQGSLGLWAGSHLWSGGTRSGTGSTSLSYGSLETPSGAWSMAQGSLSLNQARLDLRGSFSAADLGVLTSEQSRIRIQPTAVLNNLGTTLNLGKSGTFGTAGLEELAGTIQGGTIVADPGQSLNLNWGTLENVTVASSMTFSGYRTILKDTLTIAQGVTLDAQSYWNVESSSSNAQISVQGQGASMIQLNGNYITNNAGTLTLGGGLTIQGHGVLISGSQDSSIINLGTILANHQDSSINIYNFNGSFINRGQVLANRGTISVDGYQGDQVHLFTNEGLMGISQGGSLALHGNWSSTGSLSLAEGTLELGGTMTTATLQANLHQFTRSGGEVNFAGTLDNSSQTLAIGSSSPFGSGGLNVLSGSITGGTLTSTSDSALYPDYGTLDTVTLATDLRLLNNPDTEYSSNLIIKNSLTLKDGVTLDKASSNWNIYATSGTADIAAEGTATIRSTGGYIGNQAGTLNLAQGLTLRGAGGISQNGSTAVLNNAGTIIADIPNDTFTISNYDGTFNNSGTFRAQGGRLQNYGYGSQTINNTGLMAVSGNGSLNLSGQWTNTGTMSLTSGTLELGGTFTVSALGNFERSGGTVDVTGTLNNAGQLLNIGNAGAFGVGGLGTLRGSIVGGTLTSDPGQTLNIGYGTLDNVTLGSNFALSGYAVYLENQLTLSDGITLDARHSDYLYPYSTTGTFNLKSNGNSLIQLDGGGIYLAAYYPSPSNIQTPSTLNIQSGVKIEGWGEISASSVYQYNYNTNQYAYSGGTINNAGTIVSNKPDYNISLEAPFGTLNNTGTLIARGGEIYLSTSENTNFINSGKIVIDEGGRIDLSGSWSNQGEIQLTDGTLNLGGNFSANSLALNPNSLVRTGGTINLTGTLNNADQTLNIGSSGIFGAGGLQSIQYNGAILGGTLSAEAGHTLSVGGGTLDTVTLGSNLRLKGYYATINNSLTLAAGSTLSLIDGTDLHLYANSPTFNLKTSIDPVSQLPTQAKIQMNGVSIYNYAGTFNIGQGLTLTGQGSIVQNDYSTVNNAGMIIATSPASTFYIDNDRSTFNNSGTLLSQGGEINLSGYSGAIINAGLIASVIRDIGLEGTSASTTNSASGTLTSSPGSAIYLPANFNNQGLVNGAGNLLIDFGSGFGTFDNQGVVDPGFAGFGTLTIQGNFTQQPSGTLRASGYNLLQVNGTAVLGGTVQVDTPPEFGDYAFLRATTLSDATPVLSGIAGSLNLDLATGQASMFSYGSAAGQLITWDGGGGDLNWNNPVNWSTDILPDVNSLAIISGPGLRVSLLSGSTSLAGLALAQGAALEVGATQLGAADLTVSGRVSATGSSEAIVLSGGTLNTLNAVSASGLTLQSGLWNLGTNTLSTVGHFTQSGGTVGGSGTLVLNSGQHAWTGGVWGGGGTSVLSSGASLTINPSSSPVQLAGRTAQIQGQASLLGALTASSGSNTITIAPGGTLEFISDGSYTFNNNLSVAVGASLSIANAGTLLHSGNTTTQLGALTSTDELGNLTGGTFSLTSSGTLDISAGTLQLNDNSFIGAYTSISLSGDLNVAADAALRNSGGVLVINPGANVFSVNGTLATHSGGVTSLDVSALNTSNPAVEPTIGTLLIGTDNRSNGIYGTEANFSLTGLASVADFFQAGGTLNVGAGSTLTLTNANEQWLDLGAWTGSGTINLAPGAIAQWGYGGPVSMGNITVNLGIGSSTDILDSVYSFGDTRINNSGALNIAIADVLIQGKLSNADSIAGAGRLTVEGGFSQSPAGSVALGGFTATQTAGTMEIEGGISVGNAGITLSAPLGGVVIGSTAALSASGSGTVSLTGTGNGSQPHGVVVQGWISTDSGSLTVTGTGGVRTVSNSTDVEAVVGVAVAGGTLQSASGLISLTGTGGLVDLPDDPSPQHDLGVYVDLGGVVKSTNGGSIQITGFGATGTWADPSKHEASAGVAVDWGSTIETNGAGNINLNGTASSATSMSVGVAVLKNSRLETLGTGSISINGEAAGATNPVSETLGLWVENASVKSAGTLSVNTASDVKLVAGHLPAPDFYTPQATVLQSGGNQTISAGRITLMGGESGSGLRVDLNSQTTQDISASNGLSLLAGDGGDLNLADTNNLGNWVSIKSEGDQTITVGGAGLTLAAGGGAGTDNAARIWNTGTAAHQSIALIGGASLTMTGGTSPQTNVGSTHGSQSFIQADGLSQSIDFAGTGSLNPGVLSLQGGSAGSRARAQIWANGTASVQSITGASLVSLQGGAGGGVSGEGNIAVIGGLGTVQTLDVGSISVTGGGGVLDTDFDNYAQIRWQNGTQTLLTSGNVTLQMGAVTGANAAIVAPVQRGTINGNLTLTGGTGGASTSPGSARLGGWNSGTSSPTDILMTVTGNVNLNGGSVNSSGAVLGNGGDAAYTIVDLTIGGDLTMTPNASSTRIGSSSNAMGPGSIAIDAANITVGSSSAINTAGDLSLLSAGTLASNGGIRGATVTAVAGNGVSIGAAGFFTATNPSGTALVVDAGLGTFSSLRTAANTLGEVNGGMNVDTANGGKWALYVADPTQLTNPGSINYAFKQYGVTRLGGQTVLGSGNGVFFGAVAPTLSVQSSSTVTKVYDGTNLADVSGLALSAQGATLGDTVTLTPGAGTFASKNAGTINPVSYAFTVSGAIDASGKPVWGYSGGFAAANGTITPASLSVTGVTAANKIYNADRAAALSGGTVSPISGDMVSLDFSAAQGLFDTKDVTRDANGNPIAKSVTASGFTLSGNDAGNYQIVQPSGLSAIITPVNLSMTGASAQSRDYNGTNSAAINMGTLTGFVGSEAVTATAIGTFDSKNAGTRTATATYTLADGVISNGGSPSVSGLASNYSLAPTTGLTATIFPAALTLSAVSASKVYDGSTISDVTPTVSGTVFSGDAVTGLSQTFNAKDIQGANTLSVSSYTINDGNGGNNYAVTLQTASGAITQRPLSTWTGAGGNSLWSNPQNWDALPDLNNVAAVSLPAGSGSVVFDGSATAVTLQSLNNASNFTLNSTGLTLGALANAGTTTVTTTVTLGDVTNSGQFTVASGTTTVASYVQEVTGAVTTLGVSGGTTGTLAPTSGTVFIQAGTLAGKGQILGSLSVGAATVAPGFSPGNLAISGNLTLAEASTLSLELGEDTTSNSDSLTVVGTANLKGTLSLSSDLTYRPNSTNRFNLISAGDVTGTFAETQADSTLLASLSFSQLQMTVGGTTLSIPSAITFASSNDDLLGSTADPLPDLTSTLVDAGSVTNTLLAPPTYDPTVSTDPLISAAASTTASTTTATSGTTNTNTASNTESTTAPAPTSTQSADASTSGSTSEEDKKKEEEDKKKAASAETTPGQSTPAVIEPPSTAVTNAATDTSTPASLTTVRSGEVASLGIDPEPQANVPAAPSGNKEVTYAPTKSQDEKNSGGKPGPTSADEKC